MPPKTKLHKSSGKPKSLPHAKPPQLGSSIDEPAPALSPEQAQQFELELCWCIQQLQVALNSGKLNEKQVQDHTKALNTLMNNSAPIIKKRQVMRLSFGDYRAKMAAEDKKLKGQSQKIKVSKAAPCKRSSFIKKSVFLTSSDNSFKFNFEAPKPEDVVQDLDKLKLENESQDSCKFIGTSNQNSSFQFTKSDNTFRFNFTCDS